MAKQTKHQTLFLTKAIELAQTPGGCQYSDDNNMPYCVIGQLAYLEGVTAKTLATWDLLGSDKNKSVNGSDISSVLVYIRPKQLARYDVGTLVHLQSMWDTPHGYVKNFIQDDPKSLTRLRKAMKAFVAKAGA